jgi:hypothetical protein
MGINALGLVDYFTRLYKGLGIIMTPNVLHLMKEKRRTKRLQKVKKQDRAARYAKQKVDKAKATTECAKRDGTYKKGQNLDNIMADDKEPPVAKRKSAPTAASRACTYCGKKGHSTTKSKNCGQYGIKDAAPFATAAALPVAVAAVPVAAAPAAAAPVLDVDDDNEVEEMDDLYCRSITDDQPSDEEDSFGSFQDCQTWSDEDGFELSVI